MHNCGGYICIYYNTPDKTKTGKKKICEEYIKEANIQNKMRHDKCDTYTAKETLRYWGGKSYISTVRRAAAKRRNKKRNKIHKQITKAP